jgi:hypothetical protein
VSDKLALRQIIEIAAAALAEEEGSEEIEMEGEEESEEAEDVRERAQQIRRERDAE